MIEGFPIVLTADRTLTADYRLLFDGMLAASQTTSAPPAFFGPLLMPHRKRPGRGRRWPRWACAASRPPCWPGIHARRRGRRQRRPPGPGHRQRHARDRHFFGRTGRLGNEQFHDDGHCRRTDLSPGHVSPLAGKIHRLNRDGSAKIVLGGPGAWQVAGDPAQRQRLGIDHVVAGYAEKSVAAAFRRLLRQEPLPAVVPGGWEPDVAIPPIRGASTMGVVEISRGCGLGCSFCTIARVPMVHLPPRNDPRRRRNQSGCRPDNVAGVQRGFLPLWRRGHDGRPEALIALLRRDSPHPQVRLIQIDHANAASVAQYDDRQLDTHPRSAGGPGSRPLRVGERGRGNGLRGTAAGGRCGGENGAARGRTLGRFLRAAIAAAVPRQVLPHGQSGDRAARRKRRASAGNPGMGRVARRPAAGHLSGPLCAGRRHAAASIRAALRPLHWALDQGLLPLNFRWVPWFYRDNQAAAGVLPCAPCGAATDGLRPDSPVEDAACLVSTGGPGDEHVARAVRLSATLPAIRGA